MSPGKSLMDGAKGRSKARVRFAEKACEEEAKRGEGGFSLNKHLNKRKHHQLSEAHISQEHSNFIQLYLRNTVHCIHFIQL